jgi:hypothetical protein
MVKRDLVRDMGEFSFIEQLILNYQTRNQRVRLEPLRGLRECLSSSTFIA